MSHAPLMRLDDQAALVNLSDIGVGFAYSGRSGLVLCGYLSVDNQRPRPIAVAVGGPVVWNVMWTEDRPDKAFSLSADDLQLQPRGALQIGEPPGGSLVIAKHGVFIAVNRQSPGDPIHVISPYDGMSGRVPLADAVWTNAWSVYGYRKGILVFEHQVDPPEPSSEADS